MAIDILQVEDNPEYVSDSRICFDRSKIPSKGVLIQAQSVQEFIEKLGENKTVSRFLLDGKFPQTPGGLVVFNLHTVLEIIQAQGVNAEMIVIYSAEDLDRLSGAIPVNMDKNAITIMPKGGHEMHSIVDVMKKLLSP